MMKTIALDIETIGVKFGTLNLDESTISYLRSKYGRQRTKKTEEHWTAVDSDLATIVCIGVYDGDETVMFSEKEEKNEASILEEFWAYIGAYDNPNIVTFYGKLFDIPIIMKRSILHKVHPSMKIPVKKYDETVHCDLANVLSAYTPSNTKTLNFYCDHFGIEKDVSVDGGEIADLYERGLMEAIETKCEGDIIATYELYKRVMEFI